MQLCLAVGIRDMHEWNAEGLGEDCDVGIGGRWAGGDYSRQHRDLRRHCLGQQDVIGSELSGDECVADLGRRHRPNSPVGPALRIDLILADPTGQWSDRESSPIQQILVRHGQGTLFKSRDILDAPSGRKSHCGPDLREPIHHPTHGDGFLPQDLQSDFSERGVQRQQDRPQHQALPAGAQRDGVDLLWGHSLKIRQAGADEPVMEGLATAVLKIDQARLVESEREFDPAEASACGITAPGQECVVREVYLILPIIGGFQRTGPDAVESLGSGGIGCRE